MPSQALLSCDTPEKCIKWPGVNSLVYLPLQNKTPGLPRFKSIFKYINMSSLRASFSEASSFYFYLK